MDKNRLTLTQIHHLSYDLLIACGADDQSAASLARATQAAEADGLPNVGLSHLVDYLESLKRGQLNGRARPRLKKQTPASLVVDGDSGLAHLAFDIGYTALIEAAQTTGIAALAIRNTFTCGVVGYFVERVAEHGLIAQAYANAPAMVAPWGGALPFFGTNPIAFAAPMAGRMPLLIDQSTTATAFVNIREAARRNQPIPSDWGLDRNGQPTTDATAALAGTVAPSGGYKGTNLALIVDVLAAGLSGSCWSYQSPGLGVDNEALNVGQFFMAIDPQLFCEDDFPERMTTLLEVYKQEFAGHVPGEARFEHRRRAEAQGVLIDAGLLETLQTYFSH